MLDLGCLGPELLALRAVRPDIDAEGLSVEGGFFAMDDTGFCGAEHKGNGTVTVHQVDAERQRFPFDDESFDAVSSFEMIEHLKFGPQNVMRETHRVLKSGGAFVISTPNANSICSLWKQCRGEHPSSHHGYSKNLDYGVVHPFEYRKSELAALLSGYGFDVLAATTFYTERYTWPVHEMTRIMDFLKVAEFPFDTDNAGDSLLFVARKAGPITEEYPGEIFD